MKKVKFKVTFTVDSDMDREQLMSWLTNMVENLADQQCEIEDYVVE